MHFSIGPWTILPGPTTTTDRKWPEQTSERTEEDQQGEYNS